MLNRRRACRQLVRLLLVGIALSPVSCSGGGGALGPDSPEGPEITKPGESTPVEESSPPGQPGQPVEPAEPPEELPFQPPGTPPVQPPADALPEPTATPAVVAPAVAPFGNPVELPEGTEWVYVWGDEFDGAELDLTKWAFTPSDRQRDDRDHGDGCDVVNWNWSERDNVRVADGNLVLGNTRVMPPPDATDENGDPLYEGDVLVYASAVYSRRSGRTTVGGYERTYGYFEARIRIAPTSDGIHTAFWLTSYDDRGVEIDIMESAMDDGSYQIAFHWTYNNRRRYHALRASMSRMHDGNFHVFAVYWDEEGYRFYADGKLQWHYTGLGVLQGVSHVDEFIYLSTGASWGDGNACSGTFPNEALVDWVRVWEVRDVSDR